MNDRTIEPIDFRSDNTGAAAPEILAALAAANHRTATSYGGDERMAAVQLRFSELFETPVRVFPVATGTAANALALACLSPSWGAIYCSEQAHILTSEVNAAGFFSGGAKLIPVAGEHGKVSLEPLASVLAAATKPAPNHNPIAAISLTQATELGTVYTLDELGRAGALAKRHGARLHMDGARFANAVARLGCRPAEITWRAGVDILSFGVTKNGGLLCEAIVVFAPDLADTLAPQLRRAGQTWSKMRFAAAQLLAYLEDGLWLRLARHANTIADRIACEVAQIAGVALLAPVQANEVFILAPPAALTALAADGFLFFRRRDNLARLVCRFDSLAEEADALVVSLRRHVAEATTQS